MITDHAMHITTLSFHLGQSTYLYNWFFSVMSPEYI